MKVIDPSTHLGVPSVALTIGNFDGVHLGHQTLLKKLKQSPYPSCVLTFVNHPLEVLKPHSPSPLLLCTYEHKIKLIEGLGIDFLIPLTFTKELSQRTAEEFLETIRAMCPFRELILGHDATIGKNKHGDPIHLKELAERKNFSLSYLEATTVEGVVVSSSAIRSLIQKGDLKAAEKLLGRKVSIYTKMKTGLGMGRRIGFPTLNFDVSGLCLPPFGVYAVHVLDKEKKWKGVANLGIAPTVRHDPNPILEVHLLEELGEIEQSHAFEVVLEQYIRPEIRFDTVEQLKNQIAQDILTAEIILEGIYKI